MPGGRRTEIVKQLAARLDDLRAECEAQLRAIGHVEEELRKVQVGSDERWRSFEKMLQRDLGDMLTNNRDIRMVLEDLNKDFGKPAGKSEAEII
jgi:hypothetical protein